MSEQQSETTTATETGDKWGDPISSERKVELDTIAEQQRTWAEQPAETRGHNPLNGDPNIFPRPRFTGAEVFWLATRALAGPDADTDALAAAERSLLYQDPIGFPILRPSLQALHLEEANLHVAQLQGAKLDGAHLEEAFLSKAHLERANLAGAQLQGAKLDGAHLERANLAGAQLQGANLDGAHLEQASLYGAHLERANLAAAWFDKATLLGDAVLMGVSLDQVTFDGTNLTVVDWSVVTILGDEELARESKYASAEPKSRQSRLAEYKSAVRANRVLAVALRNQGLNEDADRFAYRAQLLQQQVLRRQRKFGAYLFSRLLDGLAGYGYKPVRGLIAYLVVIAGFALAYGLATHGILTFGLPRSSIQPLQWYEALVLSISSFHGRGFFQPVQSLGDPVAIIAAAEAIIGLLIEISFIATFTQRFFGR